MAKRRQTNVKDPDLLARLWNSITLSARLMLDRRVSARAKLIPLLALLYMISPIDFLPEIALGPLGAVDDMGVLLVALQLFINSAPKDVLRYYRGEAPATEEEPQDTWRARFRRRPPQNNGQIIEGEYHVRDEDF
ncbi:MAG: YkvA family protein [Chloroflexota bacterium]